MEVIVGINRACNFKCPYCSQANVMDGAVMDAGNLCRHRTLDH